jgi:hypothetical protein
MAKTTVDLTGLPDADELADLWRRARETGEDAHLVTSVGRVLTNHLSWFQREDEQRKLQAVHKRFEEQRVTEDASYDAPGPRGPVLEQDLAGVPPEIRDRFIQNYRSLTGWGQPIRELRVHAGLPKIKAFLKPGPTTPEQLLLEVGSMVHGQTVARVEQQFVDGIEARNVAYREGMLARQSKFVEPDEPTVEANTNAK